MSRRVFSDKLVSYDDKDWVDKVLADLIRADMPPELCKQVRRAAVDRTFCG